MEHAAGKENLLADALLKKDKYFLTPIEEQDFISQSIESTETNTEPQDISITTNKLSISPIPEEFTIVNRNCINFKHTDCDYNKCEGRDERLGHYPSCCYLNDENDGNYKHYDHIKEKEMQSDKNTLSTIPEEILDGYGFDPHPYIVEHALLNGYHHISSPAEDTSSVTNNDNIPPIIMDVVNDAWEFYKKYRKQHNMDCYDYYCR